jgi:phage terminase large subunit-like protein
MDIDRGTLDDVYQRIIDAQNHEKFNRWLWFQPYPKQMEFINAGTTHQERMLSAGNQVGKSDAGAYEVSRHLTGIYPAWWKGLRFDQNTGPCDCWVGGPSGLAVRDGPQKKLFGEPGMSDLLGTGFIPKESIVGEPSSGRSATGGIDTAHIKHISGAISPVSFKTYEQDRRHWQGATKKFIWFDEEPPEEIFTEGLARLAATGGSFILTFTPLMGFTEVVKRFLECPAELRHRRFFIQMALTDAAHMTPDKIEATLSMYPRHEWAARRDGNPHFAGGRIFSADPTDLMEDAFDLGGSFTGVSRQLPAYWPRLWAIDLKHSGGESTASNAHAFAAVLLAWDRDEDTTHILTGFKTTEGLMLTHAHRMKEIAANVPVAWPHDGNVKDFSGETIAALYRSKLGLNMLGKHATFPDGGYSTEAGILGMEQAMRTGHWKVNREFRDFFNEYGLYHRDKHGLIVKANDDIMSACRVGWMARRFAKEVPLGSKLQPRRRVEEEGRLNPFTGRLEAAQA